MLQTAKTYAYCNETGKRVEVGVLLDLGGQRTFILDNIKNKLGLKTLKSKLVNLNTFEDSKYHKRKCDLVKLNLEAVDSGELEIFVLSTPTLCSPLRSHVNVSEFSHLRGLQLADDTFDSGGTETIDILVGADQYFKIISDGKIDGESGPVAMNSKLGWLLAGPAELNPYSDSEEYSLSNLIQSENKNPFELEIRENRELLSSFKQLWEIETGTNEIDSESHENLDQFDIKYNGERYEVGLPWRADITEPLSTDYLQCLNRLKSLHARLKRDPDLLREYHNIIQEQLRADVIELVPKDEEKKSGTHFMPHHGVVRKVHKTTKLRIVFDGSAKGSEGGLSLNEHLENGPNFIPRCTMYWLNLDVVPYAS